LIAFYIRLISGVHAADGLGKLVAKELNLKPRESKMLLQFLKLHNLKSLTKQLEEKIGYVHNLTKHKIED
jgi:hypothetical protein